MSLPKDVEMDQLQRECHETAVSAGFTDVVVTRGKPPDDFLGEFYQKSVKKEDLKERAQSTPWFDVTTKEGNFSIGIVGQGYPMLYLKGSRVTLSDVMGARGESLGSGPENFLDISDEDGESTLRTLHFLMKRLRPAT